MGDASSVREERFAPAASKRFDFFISPALSTNVNTSRSIPDTTQVSETTSKLRSWESHATPFVWKCYATFANNHREWPLDWTHVCVSRPWEEQSGQLHMKLLTGYLRGLWRFLMYSTRPIGVSTIPQRQKIPPPNKSMRKGL